ncbi:MAG TPA: ABC transporter transmembrane domain-containing protein, partial [Bacteroidales bacterium]|nr:ABC transporter transmembrane domain-containing protein [Bacteroidales bacterium]
MNKIKLLLKYIAPYKWQAFNSVVFNILSAVFALVSYTLAIPFLKIMFNRVDVLQHPGDFQLSIDYFNSASRYFLSLFIDRHGQAGALLIVSVVFVIASLLKNGFIFLANNSMAYIRSYTVRDLRKKMFDKVLKLPLSYFSDARKGDLMTRISNDVQEIEVSVMSSLTMLFRDPMYILIFVIYLFVSSWKLSLYALVLLPVSGWFIGRVSRTLRSSSLVQQQQLGRLLSVVEETLTGLRIVKGFNAEKKMQEQFRRINERYSKIFRRVIRKYYLASPLSEFLSTIVVMALLYLGGMMALSGETNMTPDKLIAYLIVFSQIIPPAKNITTAWFSIQKGMASIDRVDQILEAEEKIRERIDPVPVKEFREEIEFR